MRKYLIRLDDACPTMDSEKWSRIEEIINKLPPPMVGVIPANKDKKQICEAPDEHFWDKVRRWQERGWVIALHGYDHCLESSQRGINPFWAASEFAGVSNECQKQKIREGVKVLTEHGINAEWFFAPAHTFDADTLAALKEESNIRKISDGVAFRPYMEEGFLFVPQIVGHMTTIPFPGIYTFCLHPTVMTETDFEQTERFVEEHKDEFLSWGEAEKRKKLRKGMADKILSYIFFTYRKLKRR